MKHCTRLPVLALLLAAAPLAAQRAPDVQALQREIEQLNRGMEAAVNRGDARGAAAYYADEAIIRTARQVVAQGRADIDRYFADIGRATWKLDVIQVGGDAQAAYQVGRSTLVHGTGPDTSVVSFVVYWKRQPDGKLRILLDYYH